MKTNNKVIIIALVVMALACTAAFAGAQDPLPSWNDGPAKKAITAFVDDVTREGSPNYVRPAERIATFDNDGTLWAEQPMYFQFLFATRPCEGPCPKPS